MAIWFGLNTATNTIYTTPASETENLKTYAQAQAYVSGQSITLKSDFFDDGQGGTAELAVLVSTPSEQPRPLGASGAPSVSQVQTALTDIATLKTSKGDSLSSVVDTTNKVITVKLMSGSAVIDTDTIDISGMFNGLTPTPATLHGILAGFVLNKPPSDAEIVSETSDAHDVSTIHGADVTITRTTTDERYMFVWIPDSINETPTGFKFGGFTDVWQSYPVTVQSDAGKVYVSDNKTFSQLVSFEIQL